MTFFHHRDLHIPYAPPGDDLVAAARDVAAKAAARAADIDHAGAFPENEIGALHRCGLLAAPLPAALGGVGLGGSDTAPLLRDILVALGRGSLAVARLYEGHVNALALVARYGSDANLALLRAEVDAGRPSGVWMAGPPLRLLATACGHALEGHKLLASGAGFIRRPLVAADTAEGSQLVLPEVDDPRGTDVSGWQAQGMRATATGTVAFTGIAIGTAEIVGRPGDYLRPPYFRGGAWRVIAAQLGGLLGILDTYRGQLADSPHHDHPIQLARFGEALIACETAQLWVRQACTVAEGPFDSAEAVDAYVDLARNAFEQAALRAIALAQKALGLKAYLQPNPLERMIRDLATYLRQPLLDVSLMSAAAFHLRDGTAG